MALRAWGLCQLCADRAYACTNYGTQTASDPRSLLSAALTMARARAPIPIISWAPATRSASRYSAKTDLSGEYDVDVGIGRGAACR